MKTKISGLSAFVLIASVIFSCTREEKIFPPGVITASVDQITGSSARVGGKVTDNGGADVSDRGVYWSTSQNPETSGTKLQSGSGDGTFYEVLSDLAPGTKYYVKAYAENPAGISFGEETFFTTQISMPEVTTSSVTELTSVSARVGGNVVGDGGFEITERGIFWGTESNPRLTGTKLVIGSGTGEFSTTLTGLSRVYTYYIVAFARNIKGTSYGTEISFSTEPGPAIVVTSTVLNITPTSAKVGGNISSNGGSDVTDRGVFWGRTANPVVTGSRLAMGAGTGSFSQTIDTLKPAVTYYVTAYAINITGPSYGEEKSFRTTGKKPKIDNVSLSNLTRQSVKLNIGVDTCQLVTELVVDYGTTISYGSSSPVISIPVTKTDTLIAINISGLSPLTRYHFRVKAENDLGTAETPDKDFRTVMTGLTGVVYDYENNEYQTIGIGYQEWMTKNLRSVKYNTGISIPLVRKDSVWGTLSSPAYCWFGNDSTGNCNTYGAIYNWAAVNMGVLCPAGWKVPSVEDVTELVNFVGGAGSAGMLLKEPGTTYWKSPNVDSTNAYGFSARGGGRRSDAGIFDFQKVEGNWWTSDEYSSLNASFFNILFNYSNLFQAYYNKKTGMSVRCVKEH